ncbi:endonuclease MutS2 [Inconstantimicrobium mannanitabidum]|uniref:Endonuclease MutS2 n=1 Tax=Inconstantimicrobium mannanitabidum TaxID=1604901 RepID=A0ACB5RB57_9CLOT|nr:endonuclease MutS2 [Clostridium sp. TW13]GKX66099.1 endonuclease MutS2 [Clostridium sp. TW13]
MNNRALRVLEFDKVKQKVAAYATTSATKELIAELEPYETAFEVKRSLEETNEALELLMKKGNPPFEGLYNINDYVSRCEKGGDLSAAGLLKIANMLRAARRFKEYIARKDEEQGYENIEEIAQNLLGIKNLEDSIFLAIVSEDEIADRASEALYKIRTSLKNKNNSIREKLGSVMKNYSKYMQDNLYTMRGDRYVIPVKAEHKGSVEGLVHDQSSTGATLFIEPIGLVNLNNEIKELMLKEKAEIERILAELSTRVYNSIATVKLDWEILCTLDFIFAKAKYGLEINGIKPEINEQGKINLIRVRHPLIDKDRVVPSDIFMGDAFTSLIITGPNTGGKTVTLKTLGLVHIMALSGLLLPADSGSEISFFEEIYADIGDEQSIEQSLSTFSSHMTNIVEIMKSANNKSLALFDELGAGTDPTEGAALAISILEKLRARGCFIAATTHYSELKAYALRTVGVENGSVEFNVETLRPTYKLLIGIPGKSNAFNISRRLGLSEEVIEYAKDIISEDTLQFEDLIQHLQEKSISAEENAKQAEKYKLEAKALKEKYQVKLDNLENVRENQFEQARREARNILRQAREEADEIIKNMKELEKEALSNPDIKRKMNEARNKIDNSISKTDIGLNKKQHEGEELKEVYEGMDAYLPSLNQKVVVLSAPDKKGEVIVEAGIMKINVKVKDLRKAPSNRQEKKTNKSNKKVNLNLNQIDSSIDLRGLDAEEALYRVDKYLDEAYLAGMPEVSIIHGKGTGILRKSIADMLKRHIHVKSHRLGVYGEGGDGVTVVILK